MRTKMLLGASAVGALLAAAHAFNTVNQTDFPICVRSVTPGLSYIEMVRANSTSQGWYLDQTIELKVSVYSAVNTDWECNDALWTSCIVPPHSQQVVVRAFFDNRTDLTPAQEQEQEQEAYLADEPAGFAMESG